MAATSRPAPASGLPASGAPMPPPNPFRPPTAAAAPQRPIPIRTVPRAAVDALVARLVAGGAVPAPVVSEAQ